MKSKKMGKIREFGDSKKKKKKIITKKILHSLFFLNWLSP